MNIVNNLENRELSTKYSPLGEKGVLTFLGTGTSTGVPQLGCNCETCLSTDPKDKRLRCSALITIKNKRILIDAGPDLRQQLIENKIYNIDAILLTHEHYDHVGGLDDVRPLGGVKIYAEKNVLHAVERNMPYCFGKIKFPGVPNLKLVKIDENAFEIEGIKIVPIRVFHAKLPILGYRIGDIAYLTDAKTIDSSEIEKLKGLKVLVLNALRKEDHFSHLSLDEAVKIAKKINANVTYFTHASHQIGLHSKIQQELPENIHYAFDNLSIYF